MRVFYPKNPENPVFGLLRKKIAFHKKFLVI